MSFAQDFATMRIVAGSPTMRCIKPKAQWTAPAGYTYDADYDVFINAGGTVWTPTTADLSYDTVNVLPTYGQVTYELLPGGKMDTGNQNVFILPADQPTVIACQFVVFDSIEYIVRETTPFPKGAALWYTVSLEKK